MEYLDLSKKTFCLSFCDKTNISDLATYIHTTHNKIIVKEIKRSVEWEQKWSQTNLPT